MTGEKYKDGLYDFLWLNGGIISAGLQVTTSINSKGSSCFSCFSAEEACGRHTSAELSTGDLLEGLINAEPVPVLYWKLGRKGNDAVVYVLIERRFPHFSLQA